MEIPQHQALKTLNHRIQVLSKMFWAGKYWSETLQHRKKEDLTPFEIDKLNFVEIFCNGINCVDIEHSGKYASYMGPAYSLDNLADVVVNEAKKYYGSHCRYTGQMAPSSYDVTLLFDDGKSINIRLNIIKIYYLLKIFKKELSYITNEVKIINAHDFYL